jgi:hypothetical protein
MSEHNDKKKELLEEKAFLEEILFTLEFDFDTLLIELQETYDEYQEIKKSLREVKIDLLDLEEEE